MGGGKKRLITEDAKRTGSQGRKERKGEEKTRKKNPTLTRRD